MRNERMHALRLERGLTQKQVAQAVGITQSAYAMIEGGRRYPRKSVAKRLADFFGVTVDELFFAQDNHISQSQQKLNTLCEYQRRQSGRPAS